MRAYAVKVDGEINLKTIFPYERGVKVNGLSVLFNIMAFNAWPDTLVDAKWDWATRETLKLKNIKVEIVAVDVLEVK